MNHQLVKLMELKQNYEYLVLTSNEQSKRQVNYESLMPFIEELVDTWFVKMDKPCFLSITFESALGAVYFRIERGNKESAIAQCEVEERIVVSEQCDTAQTPRYVRLFAQSNVNDRDLKELEKSFYGLLLVNIRALILRCQQDQSSGQREIEMEMKLARRMQSMLIPTEELQLTSLRTRTVYVPVDYVGGDYIDYRQINDRYTCFIIADVSGHGFLASIWATGIRIAVRQVLQSSYLPDEILERLNQLLYADLVKTRSYITMLVAVYDEVEHKIRFSRAGHPQPFYLSRSNQTILTSKGGVGLGLLPDSTYQMEEVPLEEEGMLLLYTDGLLDTGRKEVIRGSRHWLEELTSLLKMPGDSKQDLMNRVEAYLMEITQQRQQTDDISVLILQFEPEESIALV
ncbi:PP2C family protein-serine/threonine phosphatase [Brevibacillus sp. MER 51]|uniref:PP2C family protein-serine/threonine phosphatase n=1 Tax=Brevibacillus sp. MER 51 TaxID=2939560 RepID=UPI00203AABCD|nr:PP2C family protein-serine/threonine phosphatase [Brevibacillus sp. MER 51]MCM3141812.1 serine/threonine-protein phosphatase [Brevibacillus sp. MER 51]